MFPGAGRGRRKSLGMKANVTIPSANVILHVQCAYMKKCNDKCRQWMTGMMVWWQPLATSCHMEVICW